LITIDRTDTINLLAVANQKVITSADFIF